MNNEKSTKGLRMKYFVLKPRGTSPYAYASREAMLSYAHDIKDENPELAEGLIKWVQEETPSIPPIDDNRGGR